MKVLVATTCTPDDRKTLAVVRSLGIAGHQVVVGSDDFQGQAYFSKYVRCLIRYPHPSSHPGAFLDSLEQVLRRARFDAVLPTNDYTTIALAAVRPAWRDRTSIVAPAPEPLAVTRDKLETDRLARQLGIPTPLTFCPADEKELRKAAAQLSYPCVFKLRKGAGSVGLKIVNSWDELLAHFHSKRPASDTVFDHERPLIQEHVPGEVHDVGMLFCRGELRAALTQRRLRMYPAWGGVGIDNVTTDEPTLRDASVALLKALQWHGPGLVEFRVHPETKRAYLIEINGRYWGTLDLAIQAGVNIPLLAARMAIDGDVDPVTQHEVGLRYRWPIPFGALHAWETGQARRSLSDFYGPTGDVLSDLRADDPGPHLAECAYGFKRIVRSLLR